MSRAAKPNMNMNNEFKQLKLFDNVTCNFEKNLKCWKTTFKFAASGCGISDCSTSTENAVWKLLFERGHALLLKSNIWWWGSWSKWYFTPCSYSRKCAACAISIAKSATNHSMLTKTQWIVAIIHRLHPLDPRGCFPIVQTILTNNSRMSGAEHEMVRQVIQRLLPMPQPSRFNYQFDMHWWGWIFC